jgi:transcriptional regulator with XRE-family HTH domain
MFPSATKLLRMASVFNESVAAEIRRQLVSAGRSQSDLAALLGWSQPYLTRRMTSRVAFSLSDVEQIATALDVPRSQLLSASLPQRGGRKAG